MYYDYTYIIFVLPTVIFALIAQAMVKSRFATYSKVGNRRGLTGKDVAQAILNGAGIYDVTIEEIQGSLTDNYDPRSKVVHLSQSVYNATSISAAGVAAHECGHAIQHHVGYAPLTLRNAIIPITNIGSRMSMPLILAGLLMEGLTQTANGTDIGYTLIMIGIFAFGLSVLFQVITLPVEFNASHRALKILGSSNLLDRDELSGARKVLWAAAMTYVAAMAQSLAYFLRLLVLFGGRRRDD